MSGSPTPGGSSPTTSATPEATPTHAPHVTATPIDPTPTPPLITPAPTPDPYDQDGDGVRTPTDCDDQNPTTYPNAPERCDAKDNDCDGVVDDGASATFFADADQDGFGDELVSLVTCPKPEGYVEQAGDCNDQVAAIHPQAVEVCDGVDQNCDGQVDEGATTTYYQDADLDTFGSPLSTREACSTPDGYVVLSTDCDDSKADVHPGATELCNGRDDNCDAVIDEGMPEVYYFYQDLDQDGFGDGAVSKFTTCAGSAGMARLRGDCDDGAPLIFPGAAETSDGIDSDCGGTDGVDPHVGLNSRSLASIQAAVSAVSTSEQTIFVGGGTYLEHNVAVMGKSVRLYSIAAPGEAVIDAQQLGRVFNVLESYSPRSFLSLDGFTLSNGLDYFDGGAVLVTEADLEVRNCRFLNNSAMSAAGGALAFYGYKASGIGENLTFIGNSAKTGGALSVKYTDVSFRNLLFKENDAETYGGGIYLYRSAGTYDYLWFEDNSAEQGGGMHLYQSSPTLSQVVAKGNYALSYGGGLDLTSTSNARISHLYCEGNASANGGALALGYGAAAQVTNALLIGNTGRTSGGAVYVKASSLALYYGVAANNYSQKGGGLYTYGAETILLNTALAYNAGYNWFSVPGENDYIEAVGLAMYTPSGSNANVTFENAVTSEPGFMAYDGDGIPTDFHLQKTSPLVDIGAYDHDLDGTDADLGAYGGIAGGGFDKDFDLAFDYFWPGAFGDAPVSTVGYDCQDNNPAQSSCP